MVLDFGMGLGGDNLFTNSSASGEGIAAPIVNQIIWKDVGIGIVPIGSVVAWCKNLATAPPLLPNYVECNGQVLADGDSPFDGATIPDLNGSSGTERFLRGQTTSGGTGGSEIHTHRVADGSSFTVGSTNAVPPNSDTGGADTKPSFYEVVWIMRIK